MSDLTGRDD